MRWTQVQHPVGLPPSVSAVDGASIPIPHFVHGEGGRLVTIPRNANVRVGSDDGQFYYVEIDVPSRISGDTRMVLAAGGIGTARGAARAASDLRTRALLRSADSARSLFAFPRFLIGQVASRAASFVIGVLTPNQPASEIFARRVLPNGAEVKYVILVQ